MEDLNYKDYTLKIEQDYRDDDPTGWTTPEERGATFALYHRQYNLPMEIDLDFDNYGGWMDIVNKHPDIKGKPYKVVRWYEHSGVSVSLQDDASVNDWDAGIVGIIFGETTQDIENAFSDWKMYIEGDIWSVTVEDPDGDFVDNLGMVYGYDAAILEGQYLVDYELSKPRAGHKPQRASALHS